MFFREAVRYPVLFAAFLLLAASCGGESTTSIEVDVANADFIEDTAGEGFDAISDAPDAIEDFSETKIDAENDIPADIEIITDMMEAKETDAKDVKEETVLPAKKIYRISQMSVKNPKFCFDVNNQCLDITTQVNTYIDQSLNDLEEPMNILLFFDPFHPGGLKPSVLKLGEGVCKIENQTITACKLSEFGNPAVFEDVVVKPDIMSSLCHDKPQIIPACFVTEEKAMELYFMDIFISFKEGYIAGHFDNAYQLITNGYLKAFIPVNTTKGVKITMPDNSEFLLYDLLKFNPTENVGGVDGWFFEFGFAAKEKDLL